MKKGSSRFERHPKKTLAMVVLAFLFTADVILEGIHIYRESIAQAKQHEYRAQSSIFHHGLAPNVALSGLRWGPLNYSAFTNSLGFRDFEVREVPKEPPEGIRRLLIIGDSFIEGIGYNYEDTVGGVLAQALQRQNVEVLNASASSYSPTIYLRKLRHLIEDQELKVHEVLVFIDISDIQDDGEGYEENPDQSIRALADAAPMEDSLWKFIRTHSYLLNAPSAVKASILKVKERPETLMKKALALQEGARGGWTIDREAFERFGKKGLERAGRNMTALLELLRSRKIPLYVAIYPWRTQIFYQDLHSHQVEYWSRWADKKRVPLLNYFPIFISQSQKTDERLKVIQNYFIPGDVHWNEKGHRLMAERFLHYYKNSLAKHDR